MYTRMKNSDDSFVLLRIIANDCYKVCLSLLQTFKIVNAPIKKRWSSSRTQACFELTP